MLLDTLNKLLIVLFFMSCLNTIRHAYYFIQAWVKTSEELPTKYILSKQSLFLLGVSIAYILTTIFTGIKI
jgi:hypothetical protein